MQGTMLYGPGDVRFRGGPPPFDSTPDRRDRAALGDVRLRLRPVALPRHRPVEQADADGPRVLRHRRGGGGLPTTRPHPRAPAAFTASLTARALAPSRSPTPRATPRAGLDPEPLASRRRTGWSRRRCASSGSTAVVVGDGAVGLLGVSAKQKAATRESRHPSRQALAREFGATDVVAERGDEGVARVMELTRGVGADAVLECVGTSESMAQALHGRDRGAGASSAFLTACSSTGSSSSSATFDCTEVRRRCVAICPS